MANFDRYGRQEGGRSFGGNGRNQNNPEEKSLPQGYLSGGYYEMVDGEKVMKKDYILSYPREIAQALSVKRDVNKQSQIRKFYEYSLRIQGILRRKNGDFKLVETELNRLIPHAHYAMNRGTISELFKNFIERNLKSIHNAEDLNAFIKHFEAIVAYLPKEKN